MGGGGVGGGAGAAAMAAGEGGRAGGAQPPGARRARRKGAVFGAEAPLGGAVLRLGARGPPGGAPRACAGCLAPLPPWAALRRGPPCWALGGGEAGGGTWRACPAGCGELFCSEACEVRAEHRITCPGAAGGRRVSALAEAAAGLPDALLLAARVAVKQARGPTAGSDDSECAALARAILQGPMTPWWEAVAARRYATRGRKRRARAEAELKDEFLEACTLLLAALRQEEGLGVEPGKARVAEEAHWDTASGSAQGEWLNCGTLARVAGFLEQHAVPFALEGPLPDLCRRLVSGKDLPPEGTTPQVSRASASRQLLAASSRGASEAERSALAAGERDGGNAKEDAALTAAEERALVELAENAAQIFSRTEGLAVFPRLGRIPHSCIPNVQLEAVHSGSPGGLRLTLVALRDLEEGEPLHVAKVPVAGTTVAQRLADLRALEGLPSYECMCARCAWEHGGERREALGKEDLRNLARQAQEEHRWGDARRMFDQLLGHDHRDGEALHGVGVCLLSQGHWAKAHAAWAQGLELCPRHPHMLAIAEKGAAYAPAVVPVSAGRDGAPDAAVATAARSEERASQAAPAAGFKFGFGCPAGGGSARADVQAVAAAGSFWGRKLAEPPKVPPLDAALGWEALSWPPRAPLGHEVVVTRAPVLDGAACERMVAAAEAEAARRGGWSTARHYGAPTTDLPLHQVPEALAAFNAALRGGFASRLAGAFSFAPGALRVHDAFVVKYQACRQRALPAHSDESEFSLTLSLSPAAAYVGGGTFFPHLGRAARPDRGHAVAFRGDLRHAGEPTTSGTRYIVAAFLYLDRDS